ncbi:MAG: hypothetical protein ACFFBV_08615 [Promethearchaeota archaeon]
MLDDAPPVAVVPLVVAVVAPLVRHPKPWRVGPIGVVGKRVILVEHGPLPHGPGVVQDDEHIGRDGAVNERRYFAVHAGGRSGPQKQKCNDAHGKTGFLHRFLLFPPRAISERHSWRPPQPAFWH